MTAPLPSPRRVSAAAVLAVAGVFAVASWHDGAAALANVGETVAQACGSPNPFLVTSRTAAAAHGGDVAQQPVLFAFRDTHEDSVSGQIELGTYAQLGTTYGLAYDAARQHVYAAAFLRRGSLFPPGGSGAILRVDLATGAITPFASLPAGSNTIHRLTIDGDAAAAEWVGRLSLADIDLDPAGTTLFAANLYDGRVYRMSLADGAVIGSFAHGAAALPWAADARPFGLAVHDGWLYHGVVEFDGLSSVGPIAHIYKSRFDGTELTEAAVFPLDPQGEDISLLPWTVHDQPVVSDIEFRDDGTLLGTLLVGIRNLALDTAINVVPSRQGDVIPTVADGTTWRPVLVPEHFDDALGAVDEAVSGGLAVVPGLDLVVTAGHAGSFGDDAATAVWYDGITGAQIRSEPIGVTDDALTGGGSDVRAPLPGSGDIEVLCAPDTALDPGSVATATEDAARVATATAVAVATAAVAHATAQQATLVALAPTLTAMAPTQAALATDAARIEVPPAQATSAARAYGRISAACASDDPYFVVAHTHAERQDLGRPQHPLTAFNQVEPLIHPAGAAQLGSVYGLAFDATRGQLYAASHNPRLSGSGGIGAIYRVDLAAGRAYPWAVLPAKRNARDTMLLQTGLGDIDLDDAARELFVVNLSDRFIYRLSVPDGALLGVFGHGATAEAWAATAYPFALAFRDGWLYHAVVPDLVRPMPNRTAIIYRSRPDGSQMAEVTRFRLTYRMPGQSISHASTFVADIAFRPNGDPIIGLRDGRGGPSGDILPASESRGRWALDLSREHYEDRLKTDEGTMGALAPLLGVDGIVSTAANVLRSPDFGALWYDNETGAIAARRVIVSGSVKRVRIGRKWRTMLDIEYLGDVEPLCADALPTPFPTATPSATPTASPPPPPTASATAVPSATATRTPTPRPKPIYLPVTLSESCAERQVHADVVLVIDASTSMLSPTSDGRSKLAAVQGAAHTFLGLMDFAPQGGSDQVAIAAFNDRAWVEQPLGADGEGLRAAIDRLPLGLATGTRLDLAVEIGIAALDTPARQRANTPVVILLTDGLPNGVPLGPGGTQEETVLAMADRARAANLLVFTIGVGQPDAPDPAYRINADLLRSIATEPTMFFQTVDGDELARIYAAIAYSLGCPPAAFWGKR